jgi:hypothetical protein
LKPERWGLPLFREEKCQGEKRHVTRDKIITHFNLVEFSRCLLRGRLDSTSADYEVSPRRKIEYKIITIIVVVVVVVVVVERPSGLQRVRILRVCR